MPPSADSSRLNRRWNCRLTTIGRKTGRPRTVTLWFVLIGRTLYLTGGRDRPQWCRNIQVNGAVAVEIAGTHLHGQGRVVDDPDEGRAIIDRFVKKYWLARIARIFGGYTASIPVVVALEPWDGKPA